MQIFSTNTTYHISVHIFATGVSQFIEAYNLRQIFAFVEKFLVISFGKVNFKCKYSRNRLQYDTYFSSYFQPSDVSILKI